MRPDQTADPRAYSNIFLTMQQLTAKNVKLSRNPEYEDSFQELKKLLILERILENYGATKATKIYVDDG